MPRFSVAFSKRKPAADEFENVPIAASEQPSFRVIERHHEAPGGRSFDGGARMAARTSRVGVPKPGSASTNGHLLDLNADDNMFADVKVNRGSGVSNTTQATSTDNSSRHSNASTAPSSTDLGGGSGSGHEDSRPATKHSQPEPPSRGTSSTKSSFLDRATRTFSFGGQKKHSIPPPQDNVRVPDLPPVLTLQSGGAGFNNGESRSRGMTASTVSTATPTNADNNNGLDLGGDFGSMFTKFDKRASSSTLKNDETAVETRCLTGSRPVQPVPPSPDRIASSAAEPLLGSQKSPGLDEAAHDVPSVPRHQIKTGLKYCSRSPTAVEDQDAKLLRESFAAAKFLSESKAPRYRREDGMFVSTSPPQSFAVSPLEDNMFEGSLPPRAVRASQRANGRAVSQAQNKVMTPAEFEEYRQQHEGQKSRDGGASDAAAKDSSHDDDEEDEINYDDDYDEQEKSRQQTKQRRKQEAHMAVYRQQMMKVTGETGGGAAPRARPSIVLSSSAPQLSQMKSPSPDAAMNEDDDDDDVPLGILQAHGFPHKSRPPTMLNATGSMGNVRAASVMGEGAGAGGAGRRMSTLPAFARNLPQDPFVGASIARPALRESLSFGDAALFAQQQAPATPGGLVGVIANEERSRALRRGSPNMDSHKMAMNGALGLDAMAGIPHHMLYSAAPAPQQPVLTPGDQAQIQMTQQMQQFMQMQMQLMHMMAVQQSGGSGGVAGQPQPHMHLAPTGPFPVADVSLQSRAMSPAGHGRMRTMSMVQPSSVSLSQLPAPSVRASVYPAYPPSMAPSERSNVGLPGRYRPVSQSPAPPPPPPPPHAAHYRASTMSGGLSAWADGVKTKSTVKLVAKARDVDNDDDDDDETGWEAMRAKRDMKRSLWRGKKSFGARELAL
ncbi:hypothetical protein CDD81_5439 [Ophiocordyceps australis]|uniref:Uncharacterized protein n=1 Tax=Ophiocordyceps australis TaxID=1399860 RepID=A0A2C5Y958_9HYPO|nr:hypothetical protein CDD81_5439 [Ophiocordyceps australis]